MDGIIKDLVSKSDQARVKRSHLSLLCMTVYHLQFIAVPEPRLQRQLPHQILACVDKGAVQTKMVGLDLGLNPSGVAIRVDLVSGMQCTGAHCMID